MITAKPTMNIYLFSFNFFLLYKKWYGSSAVKIFKGKYYTDFYLMPKNVKLDLFIITNLAFKAVEIFINDIAKSNKYR